MEENEVILAEVRVVSTSSIGVETRADGKKVIRGRAIVYNQLSQNLGWYREQIDPRALDDADISDVVAKFNHDDNYPLGRTPGTLKLTNGNDGLDYEIDPPSWAGNIIESIERGDVKGSSFAFIVAPGGSDWDSDPATGGEIRTVKRIAKLVDVSPVVNPAYLQTNTTVAKRDFDSVKTERERLETEKREAQNQQNQQETPVAVAPLSVYERKLQLLNTTVTK